MADPTVQKKDQDLDLAGVPGLTRAQAERLASEALDGSVPSPEFLCKIEKLRALKDLMQ